MRTCDEVEEAGSGEGGSYESEEKKGTVWEKGGEKFDRSDNSQKKKNNNSIIKKKNESIFRKSVKM